MADEPASTPVDVLARYVPALLLHRFARDPHPPDAPEAAAFPAAVLFADISGFTPLAERMVRERGPEGTEALTGRLNDFFAPLIDRIDAHGGDVAEMAGDAVVALWTPGEGEDLADAALRAAQCGLAVQTLARSSEAGLSLCIGVGVGSVVMMQVGGVEERWHLLLSGLPITQMRDAQQRARPGDVVLSPETWALVRPRGAGGDPLAGGGGRLLRVDRPLPPLSRPVRPAALPPEAALRRYIPAAVRSRLAAGHTDWLAELRPVTVLFVNLPDLGRRPAPDPADLEQTQAVVQTVQRVLQRYEGSTIALSADAAGVTLLAAMGLPPLAHEEDAARGVGAALEIQARLRERHVRSAVGIATGRAFCGTSGSAARRVEYTLIGDVVNLAARLAVAAVSPAEEILCDPATAEAADGTGRVAFETLPDPLYVKGKTEPVTAYRPCSREPAAPAAGSHPIFGRAAECAGLAEQLRALCEDRADGRIVIEGEAGIGKSCLVADLCDRAGKAGADCLRGGGDAMEKATPYHAWRPVLSRLLGLDDCPAAEPMDRLQAALEEAGDETEKERLARLAPLLCDVLPTLDLPENELTAGMTGQVRAHNTHDLLLSLLTVAARREPTVLILEDIHWLDSASWTLALLAAERVHPLLLVLTTRPLVAPLPPDCRALLHLPGIERRALGALPAADVFSLVCLRLGVGELPRPVADLIWEKAQGNPFFSEELAHALLDAGLIHVAGECCHVAPGVDLRAAAFPDSVQGVITARIDRLAPSEQLALKAASVIGRVFPFRTLRDIYPVAEERAALPARLDTLRRLDITPLDTPEPNLAYLFKHVITQEVAYNLMLFAQRRQLHRAVAEWYERAHGEDLSPFYPLLAHHWSRAEEADRALDYLVRAGEQALQSGAYQEAAAFLTEALTLDDRRSAPPEAPGRRFQRARWMRLLGEAYVGAGRSLEGRRHLEQAVTLLDEAVPGSRAALYAGLARQILQQALRRARPGCRLRPARDASAATEAARAYERLAEIHYIANDPTLLIHALLRTGNLAEVAGPSPELARAYGNLCLAAGVVPLHRVAEAYGRRAEATARRVGQPAALAWVREVTGIYAIGTGRWERARQALGEALEIYERLQDRAHQQGCRALLGEVHYHQGRFERFAALYTDLHADARHCGNVQAQSWGLVGMAQSALVLGRADEAVAPCEEALVLTAPASPAASADADRPTRILAYGLLSLARLRRGEADQARQAADSALALIGQAPPTYVPAFEGYASVAEVYLLLWEAEAKAGNACPELARGAWRARAALHRFARVFPIGRPRAWLWQGLAHWLSSRAGRAHRAWLSGLRAAERLEMPYERALAHHEIGRHLPPDDPARPTHLARADAILNELGAGQRSQ